MAYNKTFEEFIFIMEEDHADDFKILDWKSISSYRFLSEEFISRYADYLDWNVICTYQMLNEKLIRSFINKVNFNVLSNCQMNNLSVDFLFEYKKFLKRKDIKKHRKHRMFKNNLSYDYMRNHELYNKSCMMTGLRDDNLISFCTSLINKHSHKKNVTQECVF